MESIKGIRMIEALIEKVLSKLQFYLFEIGTHFDETFIFEDLGNKIQDIRTQYFGEIK